MSDEDAQARADAIQFADSHVPMALEPPDPVSPLQAENPQPYAPGPVGYCRECDLDLHVCSGCGKPLAHGTLACGECAMVCVNSTVPPQPEPEPQPPVKQKRTRRKPEQIAEDARLKALAKEEAKKARADERDRLKIARAQERIDAKAAVKAEKIREAEGGYVELPALVARKAPGETPAVRPLGSADAWAVVEMYLGHLFVDCETSGYPLGHQLYELRTIQLGGEEAAVVFDARDPAQLEMVSIALALAKKISAHSAGADAIPLVAAGLITWDAIWAKMHDSVLYLKLIDPKLSGSDASKLKEVAGDLLGIYAVSPDAEKAKNALFKALGCLVETDVTTPADKNGWMCVNRNSVVMTVYAGSDVLDLAAVMRVLPPLPVADSVLERERWFEAKCARVGLDGFGLNKPHIKQKIAEHEKMFAETQANVLALSAGKITNPKSPEVAKALIELFPGIDLGVSKTTGNPSAAKKELEKIARTDDPLLKHLCRQILDHRHYSTNLSLLLRPLENLCDYGDSRMRPTVYTINADTGRCSCVRPNGQQFSRQGGIRACVCADCGMVMCNADFQGCEILVAAGLSGDQGLLEAETSPKCYACGRNPCECGMGHTGLHWLAAHEAFGHEATKEHRYWCKRGIFCKLFGGGPDTAAAQVYCDVEPMKKIFAAFEELAPVYTAWDGWLRQCFYEGKMVWRDYEKGENFSQDIEGKRRGIYRTYSGRNIYVNAPHAFGNYAIQGTARELLVDGVIRWSQSPWGDLPLLPIHDELLLWVPEQDFAAATAELKRCMETDVLSSPGFPVHIGADPEMTPYTYWPDSS
jgi:DNA polymerase I-like protein with 3'-5' exonuclease and polymerase domains